MGKCRGEQDGDVILLAAERHTYLHSLRACRSRHVNRSSVNERGGTICLHEEPCMA